MRVTWIQASTAVVAAVLALLLGGPLRAANETGVRTVAEELGSRTKTPDALAGAPKGLSDSAVRVMSTFALSILPDEISNRNGSKTKLDKSDPNKFLIPLDDARAVIKVATRSAYAEACNLPELLKANFNALVRNEQARLVWSTEQMMFIEALHTFATSYFAGNVKITEQPADDTAAAKDTAPAPAKDDAAAAKAAAPVETITSKKLLCSPEQKEKVTQAIGVYVQAAAPAKAAAPATPPAAAPAPQAGTPAPAAGGAN